MGAMAWAGLQSLFEGTSMENFHVQTLWAMVGSQEFLPKFPVRPVLAAETSVSLLLEFPDLDIANFTAGGVSTSPLDPLTLLMGEQLLPLNTTGMNSFEAGFRLALTTALAALANVPISLVDLTTVGVMGEQHEGQWWVTGVVIGARVQVPVSSLGTTASAAAFVAAVWSGLPGLFPAASAESALYGIVCLTMGVLNKGTWLMQPFTVVDVVRVQVRSPHLIECTIVIELASSATDLHGRYGACARPISRAVFPRRPRMSAACRWR